MIVLALYALSGAAGLILEAVFLRQLSLLLGSGAVATTVVLAAFMGGLAIGAIVFGPVADRGVRPLRLYGLLEVGAGITGIALAWLLGTGRGILVAALRSLGSGPVATLAETLLAAILLLVPTALMGGTLPTLGRFAVREPEALLGPLGLLYGVNTLGGAVGVLAAGFLLFERVGVARSGFLAGGLSLLVGGAALGLERAQRTTAARVHSLAEPRAPDARTSTRVATACLAATAVGGAAVLGYEVVWTRLLSLPMRSFSYSFSLMLSLFLLGLVLGSLALSALAGRVVRAARVLGFVQLAMGVCAAAGLLWLPRLLLPPEGTGLALSLLRSAVRAAAIVLPPTILSGMALPLAARAVTSDGSHLAGEVGRVVAANTLGSIAGALAAGLVLMPALGAPRALAVLAIANAASGAVVLFLVPGVRRPGAFVALALTAACAAPLLLAHDRFVEAFLRASRGRERIAELLYFHEGVTDTVAIVKKDYGFYDPDAKSLLTNGVAMSATVKPVWRYMAVEGHLPVLLAPLPRRVLVIGLGTGITLGAVASQREPASITAVELSEGVLSGLRFFAAENERADRDARVRLVHADGRHFLERTDSTFDAITLEPPPPIVAGSSHLYSLDFYALARRHLVPGGVLVQWLPLHAQSLVSARMTARTFLDEFPSVQLWLPSIRDAVLVGSDRPLGMDARRVLDAYGTQRTRASLARAYLETPEAFLATLLLDREGVERFAGSAPEITDERPRSEFFRSLGPNMTDREIAPLFELPQASWGFVTGMEESLAQRVETENRALRLYLRSETEESASLALEAARLAAGTEFFRYRLGCAGGQLEWIARALDLRGADGSLQAQLEKCRGFGWSVAPAAGR